MHQPNHRKRRSTPRVAPPRSGSGGTRAPERRRSSALPSVSPPPKWPPEARAAARKAAARLHRPSSFPPFLPSSSLGGCLSMEVAAIPAQPVPPRERRIRVLSGRIYSPGASARWDAAAAPPGGLAVVGRGAGAGCGVGAARCGSGGAFRGRHAAGRSCSDSRGGTRRLAQPACGGARLQRPPRWLAAGCRGGRLSLGCGGGRSCGCALSAA